VRQSNKKIIATVRADRLTIIPTPEREFYLVFGKTTHETDVENIPDVKQVARIAISPDTLVEIAKSISQFVEPGFNSLEWLTLSEQSLDFWDNEKDSAYDAL
jgi:hypothetical protein